MTPLSRPPGFSYRLPGLPAGSDVARGEVKAADDRRLADALHVLEQLPRLMRAAGIARVRIDADGQMVFVFGEAVQP